MPNMVQNVVAPKPNIGGGVYVAPLATALPTDSTTALAVAFLSSGYIDTKGVEEDNAGNTSKIHAWGGDLVKVVRSQFDVSYQFNMIEILSANANGIAYGTANVTATAATATVGNLLAVKVKNIVLPRQIFCVDMIDGIASVRVVIPNGQVTTLGKVTYADNGAAMLPVTVTAYPDSFGVNAYKYSNDGVHL